MRKEPETLMKNVAKGNDPKRFVSGEAFIKYLATAPHAPPIATAKIFVRFSNFLSSERDYFLIAL